MFKLSESSSDKVKSKKQLAEIFTKVLFSATCEHIRE